jgi:hypothetical protein
MGTGYWNYRFVSVAATKRYQTTPGKKKKLQCLNCAKFLPNVCAASKNAVMHE